MREVPMALPPPDHGDRRPFDLLHIAKISRTEIILQIQIRRPETFDERRRVDELAARILEDGARVAELRHALEPEHVELVRQDQGAPPNRTARLISEPIEVVEHGTGELKTALSDGVRGDIGCCRDIDRLGRNRISLSQSRTGGEHRPAGQPLQPAGAEVLRDLVSDLRQCHASVFPQRSAGCDVCARRLTTNDNLTLVVNEPQTPRARPALRRIDDEGDYFVTHG